MEQEDRYIRFDWAIKRLLRNKANFGVLEGFLTVLLNEKVEIIELLESESNQFTADDKFNHMDIKAKNSNGEVIIIEVNNAREIYYLERIRSGITKVSMEHISLGERYDEVKKIYSVSILYFDIGKGDDYLYHKIYSKAYTPAIVWKLAQKQKRLSYVNFLKNYLPNTS